MTLPEEPMRLFGTSRSIMSDKMPTTRRSSKMSAKSTPSSMTTTSVKKDMPFSAATQIMKGMATPNIAGSFRKIKLQGR